MFKGIDPGIPAYQARTPLPRANAYALGGRRASAGGVGIKLGNHSFRATGIAAYLKKGGTLEKAAQMANHARAHTTQLSLRQTLRPGAEMHPRQLQQQMAQPVILRQ
jgi:integrase